MDIKKAFRPNPNLSEKKKELMEDTYDLFEKTAYHINILPETREKYICLEKLREAKMWAIECIAKN